MISNDSNDLDDFRSLAKIPKLIRPAILPDCFERSRRFHGRPAISKGFQDSQRFSRIYNDSKGFR